MNKKLTQEEIDNLNNLKKSYTKLTSMVGNVEVQIMTLNLQKDQSFEFKIPGYEACIVPATGTIDIDIEGVEFNSIGKRIVDVWDGEPEGVYVPTNIKAEFVCKTDTAEVFIAGAKFEKTFAFFWAIILSRFGNKLIFFTAVTNLK